MKRIIAMLLCFMSIVFFGCGADKSSDEKKEPQNIYAEQLYNGFNSVNKHMWNKDGRLKDNTSGSIASLWTYGAYFTAAAKYIKVYDGKNAVNEVDKALKELEWYKCEAKNAYASDNGKERPVFYDDNAWLVFGLLEMYSAKNDAKLLEKAISVQKYIYKGWQKSLGGGLLWREFDPLTTPPEDFQRNTCINAPTAMNAALIYKYTGDGEHLAWAEKIFDWTKKTLKNDSLGTYFDCIDKNGKINMTQFTYNSGCMLSAAALLYNITEKEEYLLEAKSIAEGSRALFGSKHISASVEGEFYSDNPWFRVYLFQGFLDAYKYLGDEFKVYIAEAVKGYDYAVKKNLYDKFGFLYERWDGSNKPDDKTESYRAEGRSIFGNLQSMGVFAEYALLESEK